MIGQSAACTDPFLYPWPSCQTCWQTSSFPSANLTFYLKHVNTRTVGKILDITDWDSFTEYELRCRETDMFKCRITNGLIDNERPTDIDENRFYVQEISLHHLTREFQDYLLDNYLRMSRIEYELTWSNYNSLYVVVPYYDEDCEYYTHNDEYDSEYEHTYDKQVNDSCDKQVSDTYEKVIDVTYDKNTGPAFEII